MNIKKTVTREVYQRVASLVRKEVNKVIGVGEVTDEMRKKLKEVIDETLDSLGPYTLHVTLKLTPENPPVPSSSKQPNYITRRAAHLPAVGSRWRHKKHGLVGTITTADPYTLPSLGGKIEIVYPQEVVSKAIASWGTLQHWSWEQFKKSFEPEGKSD